MEKCKRYLIFLIGIFFCSLGVGLITTASLGTSSISSIPYVLSLRFTPTFGSFTVFFSVFLVVIQIFILRKNFKLEYFLQIPSSFLFGYFIDLTMNFVSFSPSNAYINKILLLLFGCCILAFGVFLEIIADVAMLPAESFVRSIVITLHSDFGLTKICCDITLSLTACLLSILFSGHLNGVGTGTIIASLLVGYIARFYSRKLGFIEPILFQKKQVG